MAEEQQEPSRLAAAFPAPPPFWKEFTAENVKRISDLRAMQSGDSSKCKGSSSALPVRLLDLPPELRFLQPPEPPVTGSYRCFGDIYFIGSPLPTLEEMGMPRLYTPPASPTNDGKHTDRAFVLKRIAKSLLLNFLELVGIMSQNPEQYGEKIQDLRVLFINFHHLLNEYRPHQARESLIFMMQDQLKKSRAETKGIMDMKERVENVLEGLSQAKLLEPEEKKQEVEAEYVEDGSDVWGELEKEFGDVA